jgi:hypothetical protein
MSKHDGEQNRHPYIMWVEPATMIDGIGTETELDPIEEAEGICGEELLQLILKFRPDRSSNDQLEASARIPKLPVTHNIHPPSTEIDPPVYVQGILRQMLPTHLTIDTDTHRSMHPWDL